MADGTGEFFAVALLPGARKFIGQPRLGKNSRYRAQLSTGGQISLTLVWLLRPRRYGREVAYPGMAGAEKEIALPVQLVIFPEASSRVKTTEKFFPFSRANAPAHILCPIEITA